MNNRKALMAAFFSVPLLITACSSDGNNPPAEYEEPLRASAESCEFLAEGNPGHGMVQAQIEVGSGYDADAISGAGAAGPAQLMPHTMNVFGVDGDGDGEIDPHNIDDAVATLARINCENAEALTQYKEQGRVTGDLRDLVIAAYFAGLNPVDASGGELLDNPVVAEEIQAVRAAMDAN